jgi:MFS family permease
MQAVPAREGVGVSAAPPVARGRQATFVLLTMLSAAALVFAATSGVTAAIPSIARSLNASQSDVQFIADAFPVVLGALVLPAGGLLDRYGRRRGMLWGLALFGAAHVWSAIAGSPLEMIASRGLAGAGAALVLPGTLATLAAVMPAEERGRAVALWAGGVMTGGAIGLLLTGAAIEVASWRSSFLLMGVLGLVTLAATARYAPETFDPEHARIDPPGALFAAVAIGSLVLAIIELPVRSLADPLVLGALCAGALALGAFVRWELRAPRPLLDVRLFGRPSFAIGTVSLVLVFGAGYGWFFLSFQYSSVVLGYTPLLSGVALVPSAFSVIPLAMLGPSLAARHGRGPVIAVGLLVMSAGAVVMLAVSTAAAIVPMAAGFFVFAGGIGLASTPPTDAIIEALPPAEQGVASAVNDASREIGAAVGIAVLGSLFNAGYRGRVDHLLAGAPHPLLEAVRSSPGAVEQLARLHPAVGHAVREGVLAGWQVAFAGTAVSMALGALFILAWSRRARATAVHAAAATRAPEGLLPALQLARQRHGVLVAVRFSDGCDRWAVLEQGEAIAAFPPLPGDLAAAMRAPATACSPALSVDQVEAALGGAAVR